MALIFAASLSASSDTIFDNGMDGQDCPDGRIVQSDISYNGTTLTDVDVTAFENIWGRASASDPPTLWPGIDESTPIISDFTKTGYIAAKFHVPADVAGGMVGQFRYVSYGSGPLLDFSISTQCADFLPAQVACVLLDAPPDDSALMHWRFVNGSNFWCQLQADTDYYVNIRLYDPTQSPPSCSDDTCPVSVSNYFGF
jgi:hypothetical protein